MNNPNLYNGQSLAYIGDAEFELNIRMYLLKSGLTKVKELHQKAIKYTSGMNQSRAVIHLINENIFTSEEIDIYHRGRNVKSSSNRKNISISDYQKATGFEAIIGYLYLKGDKERIKEIIEETIKYLEGEKNA